MMIVLVLASRDCKTREKQKNPSLRIQRRIIALINYV